VTAASNTPVDLTGHSIVVTGATSGIGRATAEALAAMGATVVVHGRNPAAVDATVRAIGAGTGNAAVSGVVADFASLGAVRRMAAELAARHPRIDVLVNNAGGTTAARETTADGFEWQLAVNHLAPFLLTSLLLEPLKGSAAGRIVNVSSEAHRRATLDFDDLQLRRGKYNGLRAYSQSKLANILFTLELSRRLEGTSATANSLHPGVVATNIFGGAGVVGKLIGFVGRWLFLPPAEGAATSVYLASRPEVAGVSGRYFATCRATAPAPAATDAAAAARLWEISERLVAARG
jgi:NAD(P)-dependent dehydrogenase (short-subunit alcohol dehydrogenase family)